MTALATAHREPAPARGDNQDYATSYQMLDRVREDPEWSPDIPRGIKEMSPALLAWVLIRPFTALAAFGLCVYSQSWKLFPVAVICGIWVFQRSFTNAHNLVHKTYRLPKPFQRARREVMMTLYGLMFGYASHLFKEAHYEHHKGHNRCGVNDDPESLSRYPGLAVVMFGPYFTARIFEYGFVHARSTFDRVLGLLELVGIFLSIYWTVYTLVLYFHGVELGLVQKTLALYAVEAAVLLWLFPFNAAWLPHQKCHRTMIGAARNTPDTPYPEDSVVGSFIGQMLVGGTRWHLLHHTYQGVPSCKLGAVSRLDQVQKWIRCQQFVDMDRHFY